MPATDPPQNPLLASAKRAASIGQLSQASSFEEVRLEDLDRHTSSDSEEHHPQQNKGPLSASSQQKAETGSKPKSTGRPPAPTAKPGTMHMIDDDDDMVQPNEKKDVSLRELHDPIEGDSANISWRGNSEVKSHAGRLCVLQLCSLMVLAPKMKPKHLFCFLKLKKPKLMMLLGTTQRILIHSKMLNELLRKLLPSQLLL